MFDRSTQYSYRAQKHQRHRFLKFLSIFLIMIVVYNFFTAFFFSAWIVDNNTMQPELAHGDRLIFTHLTMPAWLGSGDEQLQYKRGSIVLIDMGRNNERKLPIRILDSVIRFFTAQKISILSSEGQYYIKRVIALPGDEVSMTDYIFRVKTTDSPFRLTEFELSDRPYHPSIPQIPAIWDDSIPFSGSMEQMIMGPDEYFVVSDDRTNTNDSRTWGVISSSLISAKAVLRFWPFTKIKLL